MEIIGIYQRVPEMFFLQFTNLYPNVFLWLNLTLVGLILKPIEMEAIPKMFFNICRNEGQNMQNGAFQRSTGNPT